MYPMRLAITVDYDGDDVSSSIDTLRYLEDLLRREVSGFRGFDYNSIYEKREPESADRVRP